MNDRLKISFGIKKTGMRQILYHLLKNASVFKSNFQNFSDYEMQFLLHVRFWTKSLFTCWILIQSFTMRQFQSKFAYRVRFRIGKLTAYEVQNQNFETCQILNRKFHNM